jgi:hypothetical protein
VVYVILAALFYAMGMMHSFGGSVSKAAYDCDNFKMFANEEIDYACYRLTGSRDKYGRD